MGNRGGGSQGGQRHLADGSTPSPEWLRVLLAVVLAALLALVYVFLARDSGNPVQELVLAAIPSAIVVLLGAPALYVLLLQPSSTYGRARAEAVADSVLGRLASESTRLPQVIEFEDTYRAVDWDSITSEAGHSFDIVVYYFDSWSRSNYEYLVRFFRHKSATMRLVMADPDVPENLLTLRRLFSEYSEDVLRGKIRGTVERMAEAFREAGRAPTRLQVYLYPHHLPYSAQCLDGKKLVLSVFEIDRHKRIDSPAVVLDLTKSPPLEQYWGRRSRPW